MISRTILLTLLVLTVPVAAALADVRSGALSVTPLVGRQMFDGALGLEDSEMAGIAVGFVPGRHWGLEIDLRYAPTETETGGNDVDVWLGSANALYHFTPEQRLVPYALIGIGAMEYAVEDGDDNQDFIANWGGGFNYALSRDVALRLDLRHVLDFRTDDDFSGEEGGDLRHLVTATLGLRMQFGGISRPPGARTASFPPAAASAAELSLAALPPPATRSMDDDNDGVLEPADRCPGTAPGVRVDAAGCPADTDRDGIADFLDACIDTPASIRVDARGCPPAAESLAIDIHFGSGRTQVNPFHYRELDRAAAFIRSHPDRQIAVEVPADPQQLAGSRAENLRQALIDRYDVPPGRIVALGASREQRSVLISVIP